MGIPHKLLAILLVFAMAATILIAPASENDAAMIEEIDGISVLFPTSGATIGIGETYPYYIDLYNTGEQDRVLYIEISEYYDSIRLVFADHEEGSPGDRIYLKAGESGYFRLEISPISGCELGIFDIHFRLRSHDPTNEIDDEYLFTDFSLYLNVIDSKGTYYAQADDISISPSINHLDIIAGDSAPLYLDIKNTLNDRSLVVYVYPNVGDEIGISFPDGQRIVLGPEQLGYCSMMISVDKYAEERDYEISFRIMINDPERESVIEANASSVLSVSVTSDIISDDYYNRFFGYFENNFPSIFGESWFSALITMIAFVAVAYLIGLKLVPYVINRFFREGKDEV
jgi:hypothetical protein